MIMVRGWYHNRENGERLLSIIEIAGECCLSPQKTKEWFPGKIRKDSQTGLDFVDAAEVVWFLLKHNMPVSASLLPPNTRKLLFVTKDDYVLSEKYDTADIICRLFAGKCNLLVETTTAGKFAALSILTFSPQLVIIFVEDFSQAIVNTFDLLSNYPEQKTILLVNDSIRNDVDREVAKLQKRPLVIRDGLPVEQLILQLRTVFEN